MSTNLSVSSTMSTSFKQGSCKKYNPQNPLKYNPQNCPHYMPKSVTATSMSNIHEDSISNRVELTEFNVLEDIVERFENAEMQTTHMQNMDSAWFYDNECIHLHVTTLLLNYQLVVFLINMEMAEWCTFVSIISGLYWQWQR